MKRIVPVAAGLLLALAGSALARDVQPLTVSSPAFQNNGPIPAEHTCYGRSTSPPIQWSAPPVDARSIVVIVDDPDAPKGTFEHLVMYNISPEMRSLPSQPPNASPSLPGAAAAQSSNGKIGFQPLCPPNGTHHYRFMVLALDNTLSLPPGGQSGFVAQALNGHVIARGELDGTVTAGAPMAPQRGFTPRTYPSLPQTTWPQR